MPSWCWNVVRGSWRAWLRLRGKAGHSGTTPWKSRQDAAFAVAEVLGAVERYVEGAQRDGVDLVATCGILGTDPARHGATTIAELTAAGRPAVLVPLPTAADDHQRKNAEVLGGAGAAEVVEQKDLEGGALATRIQGLLNAPDRLAAMAAAARRLGRPDAVKVIADKAIELCQTSFGF